MKLISNNIPKLKKKIHLFLTKEDGKISKESLLKTGAIISALSIGSALAVHPVTSYTVADDIDEIAKEGDPVSDEIWGDRNSLTWEGSDDHTSHTSSTPITYDNADCQHIQELDAKSFPTGEHSDENWYAHANESHFEIGEENAGGAHAHCNQEAHANHDSHNSHDNHCNSKFCW